jgi:hypothetical protein
MGAYRQLTRVAPPADISGRTIVHSTGPCLAISGSGGQGFQNAAPTRLVWKRGFSAHAVGDVAWRDRRKGSSTAWLIVRRVGPLLVVWDGCRGRAHVAALRVNAAKNSHSRSGLDEEPRRFRSAFRSCDARQFIVRLPTLAYEHAARMIGAGTAEILRPTCVLAQRSSMSIRVWYLASFAARPGAPRRRLASPLLRMRSTLGPRSAHTVVSLRSFRPGASIAILGVSFRAPVAPAHAGNVRSFVDTIGSWISIGAIESACSRCRSRPCVRCCRATPGRFMRTLRGRPHAPRHAPAARTFRS